MTTPLRRCPSAERLRDTLATARFRELLTSQEVADRYKLRTRSNAREWLKRHQVPIWGKCGRTVRYDARDIDAAFTRLLRVP